MSCGLAQEMVACFYNFTVMEKKQKNLPHMGKISNMAASLIFIKYDVTSNVFPYLGYTILQLLVVTEEMVSTIGVARKMSN